MSGSTERRLAARRRVYLLRHAHVSYFAADGSPQDPVSLPLSAAGREQAAALARTFAEVPLDRVITSGLPRTSETAAAILDGRSLVAEEVPGLREIRAGAIHTWMPDGVRDPGAIEACFVDALTTATGPERRFLGGETFGEFRERVVPAFAELLGQPAWRTLLLVAHGGTNRIILAHALGVPLSCIGRLEQDPACVNVIDADADGRLLVRMVNHTTYAPVKEGLHATTMEAIFLESRRAFEALAADALGGGDR